MTTSTLGIRTGFGLYNIHVHGVYGRSETDWQVFRHKNVMASEEIEVCNPFQL